MTLEKDLDQMNGNSRVVMATSVNGDFVHQVHQNFVLFTQLKVMFSSCFKNSSGVPFIYHKWHIYFARCLWDRPRASCCS